jgi:hypothetical protein
MADTNHLLVNLILYGLLPLWGVTGFIDWCCHRDAPRGRDALSVSGDVRHSHERLPRLRRAVVRNAVTSTVCDDTAPPVLVLLDDAEGRMLTTSVRTGCRKRQARTGCVAMTGHRTWISFMAKGCVLMPRLK